MFLLKSSGQFVMTLPGAEPLKIKTVIELQLWEKIFWSLLRQVYVCVESKKSHLKVLKWEYLQLAAEQMANGWHATFIWFDGEPLQAYLCFCIVTSILTMRKKRLYDDFLITYRFDVKATASGLVEVEHSLKELNVRFKLLFVISIQLLLNCHFPINYM